MAMRKSEKKEQDKRPPYQVELSLLLMVGIVIWLSMIALAVGFVCRMHQIKSEVLLHREASNSGDSVEQESVDKQAQSGFSRLASQLPPVLLSPSKKIPESVYSGRHFHEGMSAASEKFAQPAEEVEVKENGSVTSWTNESNEWAVGGTHKTTDRADTTAAPAGSHDQDDDEEEHQPAGQHLLIDIKGVDAGFLDSEERLAHAMITLIEQSGLTMLSYHCHGLQPVGVSCVGVLLESHVSFHTWPVEGVITLDLFTCGPKSLLPLLEEIEKLFGVRRPNAPQDDLRVQWGYKKRGFPSDDGANPESVELGHFLEGWMDFDLKEKVLTTETEYQTIGIYDLINPRFNSLEEYKRSLDTTQETYESLNPEFFVPDRVVYLDGVAQSRRRGEVQYHESLVHPAMFALENPKRVAIIGGGEGATLREVLKHKTVEKVYMIEIDEIMVNVSRTYLPEWSDCSQLVGSASSCFDDPRAELRLEDAIGWFMERYSNIDQVKEEDKFDLIIMDALDPSAVVEFSDILYGSVEFLRSLTNALTQKGILVSQVGEFAHPEEPGPELSGFQHTLKMIRLLQGLGFEYAAQYTDAHGGFLAPWSYLIAMKDASSKKRWFANPAEIDLELQRRGLEVVDSSSGVPFRYFDGSMMQSFQDATRLSETIMCRALNRPPLCNLQHGFDPNVPNTPLAVLETSGGAEPGYKGLEAAIAGLRVSSRSLELLQDMKEQQQQQVTTPLSSYLNEYGCKSDFWGGTTLWVPTEGATVLQKAGEACHEWTRQDVGDDAVWIFQPFLDRNYETLLYGGDHLNISEAMVAAL